jgi:hypothetical protein
MDAGRIAALTPHNDVNAILGLLGEGISHALGGNLIGLYLTGSLTYGDFDRGSSDIDYLAVAERPLAADERAALRALHSRIASRYPTWAERIEGSYVTREMLDSIEPPPQGRPYVNGGAFWDPDPRYGNEWLINLYALRERGVALLGPDPGEMFPPVAVEDVREASRRDLREEWMPKLADPAFFESSHHQAYVTLTICRILHRAQRDDVASKRRAAAWVRERYPEPWIVDLVERAERWQHGEELGEAGRVRDFIRFAAGQAGLSEGDAASRDGGPPTGGRSTGRRRTSR